MSSSSKSTQPASEKNSKQSPSAEKSIQSGNLVSKLIKFALAALVIINTYTVLGFSSAIDSVNKYNHGLVQDLSKITENMSNFGNDLNEIRTSLYLPTKNYNFNPETDTETKSEDQLGLEKNSEERQNLYQFFLDQNKTKLLAENSKKYETFYNEIKQSTEFKAFLESNQLQLGELQKSDTNLSFKINSGSDPHFNLILSLDKNEFQLQSIAGDLIETKTLQNSQDLADLIKTSLTSDLIQNVKSLKSNQATLKAILSSNELKTAFESKNLKISDQTKVQDGKIYFEALNADFELVTQISFDSNNLKFAESTIQFNSPDFESKSKSDLISFINSLSSTTKAEKELENKRNELAAISKDKAFLEIISSQNLKLIPEIKTEYNKEYFEIQTPDGKLYSKLSLEISSGRLKLIKDDKEIDLQNYTSPLEESKKKIELPTEIPNYSDLPEELKQGENLLILGKNGSLIDTCIFANIDYKTGKITLISIPRDLYLNGKKINSIYARYGIAEYVKTIEKLTGYKINKHILIDMYAFMDVIDLIGGVDVYLEKPVIDPTYKTCDGGECSTLYYRAGDHHLSGKQALRLARSRHTSSDFDRASRQQLIIKAVQQKSKSLSIADAGKISEIASKILSKTETNIAAHEAMNYYFRLKNFKIYSGNVISSGNVLDSTSEGELNPKPCPKPDPATPSNDTQSTAETKPKPCVQEKGAYILVPKNNNWNLIKWFVRDAISTASKSE